MLDRTRMLVVTAALAAVTPSMAHAQKLGQGGTGFYVGRGFVHVDTGDERVWIDQRRKAPVAAGT